MFFEKIILIVLFTIVVSQKENYSHQLNSSFEFKEEVIKQCKSFNVLTYEDSTEYYYECYWKFVNALGFRESGGRYWKSNRWGYHGKYQFGWRTLRGIGIKTRIRTFKKDSALQEYAMFRLLTLNKNDLRWLIAQYSGKKIKRCIVTESGILAGAHLGGVKGVRRYLESNGRVSRRDKLKTSIGDYVDAFSGYELHLDKIEIKYEK